MWPLRLRKQLEQILSTSNVQTTKPAGSGPGSDTTGISFNNYQEMAGSCVRGTIEERIKVHILIQYQIMIIIDL